MNELRVTAQSSGALVVLRQTRFELVQFTSSLWTDVTNTSFVTRLDPSNGGCSPCTQFWRPGGECSGVEEVQRVYPTGLGQAIDPLLLEQIQNQTDCNGVVRRLPHERSHGRTTSAATGCVDKLYAAGQRLQFNARDTNSAELLHLWIIG